MIKCSSYKNYKGMRKPKCNGGKGCEACWGKYNKSKVKL